MIGDYIPEGFSSHLKTFENFRLLAYPQREPIPGIRESIDIRGILCYTQRHSGGYPS
jgi:hypothetical protein